MEELVKRRYKEMEELVKRQNGKKTPRELFLTVCHILGKHCLSNGYFEFLTLNSLCKQLRIETHGSRMAKPIRNDLSQNFFMPKYEVLFREASNFQQVHETLQDPLFASVRQIDALTRAVRQIEVRTIPTKICFLIEENEYFSLKRNYLYWLLESNPQRFIQELKILCDTIYLTKSSSELMLRIRFLKDSKFPQELLDPDDNYMARGFYIIFPKVGGDNIPSKIFDIFISINSESCCGISFNNFKKKNELNFYVEIYNALTKQI